MSGGPVRRGLRGSPGAGLRDDVEAGDFVYIPAGAPHLPVNDGATTMFAVVARRDPNEQESVVLMPELDGVPDRAAPMTAA